MINPLNSALETILSEQLMKKDKYRHDCIHCVKVLDVPIDLAFCSFKTFPKGVTTIIQCPKDCVNFFKGEPSP
jgi:hypothetical protein